MQEIMQIKLLSPDILYSELDVFCEAS